MKETMSSSSSYPSSILLDPQEELKNARIAVEDAEERLKSLTADHAPIFVAVEKRSQTCAEQLMVLLKQLDQTCSTVSTCMETVHQIMATSTATTPTANLSRSTSSTGSSSSSTMSSSTQEVTPNDSHSNNPSLSMSRKMMMMMMIPLETFMEKHTTRRKTLLHHSQLLEILELPSLMDACMKSHLYDEAVHIAIFANTLERRHYASSSNNNTPKNPILTHVIQDIRHRTQHLYRLLLTKLQGDLSLPTCLEIITSLRRLHHVQMEQDVILSHVYDHHHHHHPSHSNSSSLIQKKEDEDITFLYEKQNQFYEMNLQVDFLEARNIWLDTSLSHTLYEKSLLQLLEIEEEEEEGGRDYEEENEKGKEMKWKEDRKQKHPTTRFTTTSSSSNNNNMTILDTIEVYRTRYGKMK